MFGFLLARSGVLCWGLIRGEEGKLPSIITLMRQQHQRPIKVLGMTLNKHLDPVGQDQLKQPATTAY